MQGSADAFAFAFAITLPERLAVATPVDPAQLSIQPCPQRQSERQSQQFCDACRVPCRDAKVILELV